MTEIMQSSLFDYGQLDAETRIVVQQRTEEIKVLVRRSAQDIIDIGSKLIDVKARLGHGNFGGWLDAEFGWTDRTARQFMSVAEKFKSEKFSDLNIGASALYLLASPSTPDAARIEAVERAQSGEVITHKVAQGIVAVSKAAELSPNTKPTVLTPPLAVGQVSDPRRFAWEFNGGESTSSHGEVVRSEARFTPSRPFSELEAMADDAEGDEDSYDWQDDERTCINCKFHQSRYPNAWCTALERQLYDDVLCEGKKWVDRYHVDISNEDDTEDDSTYTPSQQTMTQTVSKPHVAHNSGNNEWYTPEEYIIAARQVLGRIDLDPATSEIANKVVQADEFYTAQDDGLAQSWTGKVWMNPPYSSDLVGRFAEKICAHYEGGDVTEAIVLVNNATETAWFQRMAQVASCICFPRTRVKFWKPDGETGAPLQGQAILYFGTKKHGFVSAFRSFGFVGVINGF